MATLRGNAVLFGGSVVLFGGAGGSDGQTPQSDTWLWNGTEWFAGPVTGPGARAWAAMTGPR